MTNKTLENTVAQVLVSTRDPSLQHTAADLLSQSKIQFQDNRLVLHLSAGLPTVTLHDTLLPVLEAALQQALPHVQISLHLDQFIKAHRTQLPGKGLRNVKNVIAVASGKGGVGKSTVAVNVAAALAGAGARVGILDADIYGPSIPLMLGDTEPVKIQEDHYLPVIAHGIQAMSIGYLTHGEQPLIWRGPMLAKSLLQLIDITQWDALDYLILDLPPGTGDIQLSLVQKIPLAGAIIITTPQRVATLDAQKALRMFNKTNIPVLGIIENMSQHICSHCQHQEAIFGNGGARDLCIAEQQTLLGQLPLDARIGYHCDHGIPTVVQGPQSLATPFIQAALQAAYALSKRPLNYADKFPPITVE